MIFGYRRHLIMMTLGLAFMVLVGCGTDDGPVDSGDRRTGNAVGQKSDKAAIVAVAQAIIAPQILEVSEDGAEASFSVSLDREPEDAVTLSLLIGDISEIALDIVVLEFDSNNWSIPQQVQVVGLEDDLADGTPGVWIEIPVMESLDRRFAHSDPEDVLVYNVDNDSTDLPRFIQAKPSTATLPPVESGGGGPDLGF